MLQLSAPELAEAAKEAGISPVELRRALARRHSTLPPELRDKQGTLLPPPPDAISVAYVEGVLPEAPAAAARRVKRRIEAELGVTGRLEIGCDLSVPDDGRGVFYRITSRNNEDGGALVRIDIDASPSRGRQTLAAAAVVAATTFFVGTAGLLSSGPFLAAGITAAVLGGLVVAGVGRTQRGGYRSARAVAAQALLESEEALLDERDPSASTVA
ncbi:MAG: hypothetical protein B7733_18125 [Myxococcales bacterium FL481]|nr:MAG: hypothetical protein B7733_18125 [Myxococcales bacterium FL481]